MVWRVCNIWTLFCSANNQVYKLKKWSVKKCPVSLSHQRYSIQIFICTLFLCSCDTFNINFNNALFGFGLIKISGLFKDTSCTCFASHSLICCGFIHSFLWLRFFLHFVDAQQHKNIFLHCFCTFDNLWCHCTNIVCLWQVTHTERKVYARSSNWLSPPRGEETFVYYF